MKKWCILDYKYLSIHKCIYDLQFGFRENHSTNHALVSFTESIRQALDGNNFACGVFIDLQKAFDTVDHNILLKKLYHYRIRGKANEWFCSYLSNRSQLFNLDLKYLCRWLKANKISLNSSKTEVIIFHHPSKPIDYDVKIKIDGQKFLPSEYVKYLGIAIDSHLNWLDHSITLCNKLARAIGMLSKYSITSLFQRLNQFTLVFSLQLCHTVLKFGVKLRLRI